MRKSLAIFCLGCVVGAVVAGGIFASLWQKAETARKEAEAAERQAEEQARKLEEEAMRAERAEREARRRAMEAHNATQRALAEAMLRTTGKETKRD